MKTKPSRKYGREEYNEDFGQSPGGKDLGNLREANMVGGSYYRQEPQCNFMGPPIRGRPVVLAHLFVLDAAALSLCMYIVDGVNVRPGV